MNLIAAGLRFGKSRGNMDAIVRVCTLFLLHEKNASRYSYIQNRSNFATSFIFKFLFPNSICFISTKNSSSKNNKLYIMVTGVFPPPK